MPQRIQLRRTKGWRKPEGAIVVSRPTKYGNPWRIVPVNDPWFPFGRAADVLHVDGDRSAGRFRAEYAPTAAVDMFRLHISELDDWDRAILRHELAGHDLACWCPLDQPCHADVLLDIANS